MRSLGGADFIFMGARIFLIQQGGDVVLVWQDGCRSGRAERQCTGKQMPIPPPSVTPLINLLEISTKTITQGVR